jgi:NTE family protein
VSVRAFSQGGAVERGDFVEPAGDRRSAARVPLRALVLGGGGILGAAYEIGALAALEERRGSGSIYRDFDIFVGTSAGAFVAALLAQGIAARDLFDGFRSGGDLSLDQRDVYRIDWKRFLGGARSLAAGLARSVVEELHRGRRPSLVRLFLRAQDLLPAGFIRLDGLEVALCRMFARRGVSNRFADLSKALFVPALDIERTERIVFGEPEESEPTICQAVAASCALPRFFGPVRVGRRLLVDGAIGGSVNVDIALEKGATHVLVINPIVPLCSGGDGSRGSDHCRSMSKAGLGQVLDQCLKIEHDAGLRSALEVAHMRSPEATLLLLEPSRRAMFSEGPMDYDARARVLDLGYSATALKLAGAAALFDGFFDNPALCEGHMRRTSPTR